MITRKIFETNEIIKPNSRKTIEPNASNKIEQIASKQKEVARNKIVYTPNLKVYLGNIPTPSLTTPFGRNNSNKISILENNQLTDTCHTKMEHISLLAVTTGSKDITIGSAR